MKQLVYILLIIFTMILFHGCTKDYSDIDEHIWRLTEIETAYGFSSKTPNIEQPERNDRYLLRFNKEDATVQMFLVANNWAAHYQILPNKTIIILGNTTTEVGYNGEEIWVEDTINAYGSNTFDYNIIEKKLTLQSTNMTMYFLCVE